MKRTQFKKLILFTLFIMFIGINVYAETTSNIHFCEYRGTLRTMMIVGFLITAAKTVVPIILMYQAFKELGKVVIGGKQDEMKGVVSKLVKSLIASLVIFFIPTIVNYAVLEVAAQGENSEMTKCTTCMFDVGNCQIPDEDPVVTTRD